jgi:hypothetical protein
MSAGFLGLWARLSLALVSYGLGGTGGGTPPTVPGCVYMTFEPTAITAVTFEPTFIGVITFEPTAITEITFEGC